MRSREGLRSALEHGFLEADHTQPHFENPYLISNNEISTMLGVLREELESSDSFIFSVAFVSASGLGTIKQQLVEYGGTGVIITSDYLDFNDPDALRELLTLDNVEVRVMSGTQHHAKGYVFQHADHLTALIGSSNLTRNALTSNAEWNLQFSTHRDGDIADQVNRAVQWQREHSVPLTPEWIADYEQKRATRTVVRQEQPLEVSDKSVRILPNAMQVEALEGLLKVREAGERRALVISATGTGKTILSAFAAKEFAPQRMLFLAHREQILRDAAQEFQRVFQCDAEDIGFFAGAQHDLDRRFTFATVQSLSRKENLSEISPRLFDLVIVDEVHRSGAETYQRVLNFFRPEFVLGITATPERTDGFNVFELFDYNVAYEIRLEGALENKMLVPFDYFGVSDYENARGFTITDDSSLIERVATERVDHIAEILRKYSFARGTKGLIFCSGNEEARLLSDALNSRRVHGRFLRTLALPGTTSIDAREEAVASLEKGELDYLLTVDIFNEGIDIPPVNVVVMLRATESPIVFTQQLGRGLRKSRDKSSLRVIDIIGNYANNYLIPIALTGDNSGSKDQIGEVIRKTRRRAIAGNSTISFDRVSMGRIVESLQKARLTDRRAKRTAILDLTYRLGKIPQIKDFENHGSMDPWVLSTTDSKAKNYWTLLKELNFVEVAPSPLEDAFLSLVSIEFMNGKRPQELMLLRQLLDHREVSISEFRNYLESQGLDSSDAVVQSLERIFSLEWFPSASIKRFGGHH
ncbi:DUF3427 domain-containing protein, partial [Corynebacterium sp. LK2510]|uniref:DUF3427 domain-containing protein n=1 Tax=Corynebacterium sp. LK2510 TaxID=3110472 RepID=UPI0034CD8775